MAKGHKPAYGVQTEDKDKKSPSKKTGKGPNRPKGGRRVNVFVGPVKQSRATVKYLGRGSRGTRKREIKKKKKQSIAKTKKGKP